MKKRINFIELLKNYKKGWVAISEDFTHVIVYGKTLKDTIKKAQKFDQKVYYFPTGESYSHFAG